MQCRACGNEERASEGYPCSDCGTFICVICNLQGVTRCRQCEAKLTPQANLSIPPEQVPVAPPAPITPPTPARVSGQMPVSPLQPRPSGQTTVPLRIPHRDDH